MRQRSSARTSCDGRVSAARIKPVRSGLTPSVAPVKLLPPHRLTCCHCPSRCLCFLPSPMPSGTNCARWSSPRRPSGVAIQTSGAGAWRPCSGWPGRRRPGDTCPTTSDHGRPSYTITVAGAKEGFGSVSSRFCSRKAPLLCLLWLFPLPNGLSGAVVQMPLRGSGWDENGWLTLQARITSCPASAIF
jgi:hypothetical protein